MITKCLDNRRYSRCPPYLPPVGIDGIQAMSRGISGTVIKLANTSNRGRVYLFSQNEKTFILVLQNVQFEFRQVLHYYGLLSEHLRCLYHIQKGNNEHFQPKFSIIVFLIKKTSFSFFKSKQTRLRFLVLITTENTITYHNALCFCHPKILHRHCLQFLLGVDQQRALWYAMVFSVALN